MPSPDHQPRHHRLCVLKFGSSVLLQPDDYARAAHEIYRHTRKGEKVVAVVSALDGETDALFDVGGDVGNGASDSLLARLVRCGELKSAALMGLALERAGIPCAVLDPHEMGLQAEGAALDAHLTGLDAGRLHAQLETADVIVAPGFFGETAQGPVTLGRGGTDLTAVVFADWLGAERVRLIKDVDGVYSDDPRLNPDAQRLDQLGYADAVKVSRGLVQEKAILAAEGRNVVIEVAALGRPYATRIADLERRSGVIRQPRPLLVAVLGHGSVGKGLCGHLLAHPGRFELNPVLVRGPAAHTATASAALRFTDDPAEALSNQPDIVVDVMGGTSIARSISQSVLRDGAHLVSANKAVIARDLERLRTLAHEHNHGLRYSAAVGGGVPIIETVDRLAATTGILAIEGVVNGTCNFVLGRLADGTLLADAIREAQALGFAEADPRADIDGDDAAEKLSILIHHAFGVFIDPGAIPKTSISDLSAEKIAAASEKDLVLKQVAQCKPGLNGRVHARIDILALDRTHPLAGLRNEANGFQIQLPHETIEIRGKGAGRWPTAEAVFADIMEIQREFAARPDQASHRAGKSRIGDETLFGERLS